MAGTKNPYSTVFWNDIEHDEKLKTCSLAAAGLWLRHMLPIAARSSEPGVVIVGAWPSILKGDLPTVLANVAGGSREVIETLLGELVMSGAASVDDQGRVFNRRMVRVRQKSEVRSEAGRRGAASRWGDGQADRIQPNGKPMAKGMANCMANSAEATAAQSIDVKGENGAEAPAIECDSDGKAMHSSSFGASNRESLTETSVALADDGSAKPKREAKGTRLPDDWRPEGELREWTIDAIRKAESSVSAGHELERFRDYWRAIPGAKGRKADWPATWRNWIRRAIDDKGGGRNGTSVTHTNRPQGRVGAGTRLAGLYATVVNGGAHGTDQPGDGQAEPRVVGSASMVPGKGHA